MDTVTKRPKIRAEKTLNKQVLHTLMMSPALVPRRQKVRMALALIAEAVGEAYKLPYSERASLIDESVGSPLLIDLGLLQVDNLTISSSGLLFDSPLGSVVIEPPRMPQVGDRYTLVIPEVD